MPIPEHIKAAVNAKVLTDLHLYWQEAEELEDDNVLTNAADRVKDFYLYQHLASHRTPLGDVKTFIIHQDAYMYVPNRMYMVQCTWRRLLEIVNDIEPAMYDDLIPTKPVQDIRLAWVNRVMARWPNAERKSEDEFVFKGQTVGEYDDSRRMGTVYKLYRELTNEELKGLFDSGNGDGQPYTTVFCLEDNKIVLGGHLA